MAPQRQNIRGTDVRLYLCIDHRGVRYKFEDGRCGVCTYWTSSPAFKFCSDCCRSFKRCQVCGQETEPPGPDEIRTYDDDEQMPAEKPRQKTRLNPHIY